MMLMLAHAGAMFMITLMMLDVVVVLLQSLHQINLFPEPGVNNVFTCVEKQSNPWPTASKVRDC